MNSQINNMNSQINNKDILYTNFYNNQPGANNYEFTTISNDILDIIGDFILIIDMPNMGGGVTFFMDLITSYYKKTTIFIIARNFNNMLHVYINNEYVLETKYNVEESILFIEKYKNNITKILFDHIIHHNLLFINKLFSIGKHTTYITHDYYNICNKAQAYFHEISILHKKNRAYIDLNLFDTLITQNEANVAIFNQYYKKPIHIEELPDFKNSDKTIKTDNPHTVVGIIGAISIEKGKEVLENIIKLFKDSNIKFVVFGYVEIKNFTNVFRYNSIKELNKLLVEHKPNILLELTLWPETYSYTLTLSMITNLPIVYLKKRFTSVVENRLCNYQKKHSFTNHKELTNLFNKYKQNYFNTIEETVYFNMGWNDYFNVNTNLIQNNNKTYFKNIENKNIVFINSKIIVSDTSFSYVKKRSIYSRQERMTQTINTIKSIRKYIPNTHIVLLDNSVFNILEHNILEQLTDTFINITDNKVLNYFTDVFEYKAFGEISQQLQFFELFLKEDYSKTKNFFKITGRYEVNGDFDYEQYDNDLNIFKKHLSVKDRDYFFTCFYKLDKSILKEVEDVFKDFVRNKEKYMNNYSDFEVIFPNAIINKIHLVDNLGIVENIGVWKKIANI
jgi:hypothetical protein